MHLINIYKGVYNIMMENEEALREEYDKTVDGETQAQHKIVKIKSKIKVYPDELPIDDIVTFEFKKISRTKTMIGLSSIVEEWGLVNPIHVLKLEDDDKYMLLDGLRRLLACARKGDKKVRVMVWDFEDKEEGKQQANIISLMINRSQRYSAQEMWGIMQKLEQVNDANPGLIEYLLQMYPGDAMKLKDVMTAGSEYAEIQAKLIDDELTIDQAYRKLCTERKKEDRLIKEEEMGVEGASLTDSDEDNVQKEDRRLSIQEAQELLDIAESEDLDNMSIEDLDMSDEVRKTEVQKVGERHPIDPAIKKATLIRDGGKCQCCGKGGPQWASILVYHHKIPVFCGGADTVENGVTLCSDCHITLHCYSTGDLIINLDELNDTEKEVFKKIFHYGNMIIKAAKIMNMSKQEVKKNDAGSRRHLMPGEGLKDNKEAFNKIENQ